MKNLKKVLFILPLAMLLSAAVTFAMNGNMNSSKSSDVELALEKKCDNCDKKDCKEKCSADKGKKSCSKAEKAKCAKGKKACCSSKKGKGKAKSSKESDKTKNTDG